LPPLHTLSTIDLQRWDEVKAKCHLCLLHSPHQVAPERLPSLFLITS
jgi:hypothetical protein